VQHVEAWVYTPKQIQQMLGLSSGKLSKLLHSGEFTIRYIGRNVRVPKAEFDAWYQGLPSRRAY
jgi:excisionase family DNA binding protein